ncbi:hypothetical protein VCRA2119O147_330001 [Vibrio crassostreae]|jgi:hypothetical protein|uniref:Uncharacterized protein n=1 Tax=Vibrio crassostreae TaxID=246167 RepID=A0A4R3NYI3_9VIBR|nr:hypothetical protein [Vibrio crassostreae]ROO50378.1 hypothetical protein EDB58_112103 [Vibrio crassostreae]TCL18247.1 hypothetical protein EDB52_12616 [Vibrio crassostreae]TCN05026.1 hypothetical protein EDB35_11918 [Vibrio crassostreae]TCN95633.1 hypothetical protein EDB30_12113 [Vibrio crassostreae]
MEIRQIPWVELKRNLEEVGVEYGTNKAVYRYIQSLNASVRLSLKSKGYTSKTVTLIDGTELYAWVQA